MLEIITNITDTEQRLTQALQTRYHNYNCIKNHICGLYTAMGIQRVEPTREIGRQLNIPKSIVSRVIFQLEDDGFLAKTRRGFHPRQNWYLVRVSKQDCFLYRNYYSLSPFKKKKFLKDLGICGAKSIDEIVKIYFGWGYEYYTESKAIGK